MANDNIPHIRLLKTQWQPSRRAWKTGFPVALVEVDVQIQGGAIERQKKTLVSSTHLHRITKLETYRDYQVGDIQSSNVKNKNATHCIEIRLPHHGWHWLLEGQTLRTELELQENKR